MPILKQMTNIKNIFKKSSLKFRVGKTNIANKLKNFEDLLQQVAQFMKDGTDIESIRNHCMSIFQKLQV